MDVFKGIFKNTNVTSYIAEDFMYLEKEQQTLLALDLKPRPSQNKQNSAEAQGFYQKPL